MSGNNYLVNIRNGDRGAFEALMLEYYQSVIMFAYRIVKSREVAEEIAQDVFINIWVNRAKLNFDVPVGNYIYVSARNLAYNQIRNNRRLEERLKKILPSEEETDAYLVLEETYHALEKALDQLPPRTSEIIRLGLTGLKRSEIAEKLNVSESNVKLLKASGIKKLKELLGDTVVMLFLL